MLAADITAALLLGFAGSSHCVFMCGGIHGALLTSGGIASNQAGNQAGVRSAPQLMLLFNLGRVASYAFAGLLVGSVGLALHSAGGALPMFARLFAGLVLLAMAAYVGRWWTGLVRLEKLGEPVWRLLEPFARQLMPMDTPQKALFAGGLWGWLPCGLVYSTLAWAMLAESPLAAVSRMLFFGLGTLPAMLASGWLTGQLSAALKSKLVMNLGGLFLLLFALWTMYPALQHLLSLSAHQHAPAVDHHLMHSH